jgi:hypothetical protein
MKRISVFALLLLGGCYATAEPLFLPDGSSGYRLSCGDYIGTPADCIAKAGEMCGANGYQMYDQAGKPMNTETQNQTVIATLNNGSVKRNQAADDQKNMFIKCKTNDAPLRMTPAPQPPQVEMKPVEPKPPLLMPPASAPPADNGPIPLR